MLWQCHDIIHAASAELLPCPILQPKGCSNILHLLAMLGDKELLLQMQHIQALLAHGLKVVLDDVSTLCNLLFQTVTVCLQVRYLCLQARQAWSGDTAHCEAAASCGLSFACLSEFQLCKLDSCQGWLDSTTVAGSCSLGCLGTYCTT